MEKPPTKKQTLEAVRADLEAKGLLKPKEAPRLDENRRCEWCDGALPMHLSRFCTGTCMSQFQRYMSMYEPDILAD
jgi:hypothetical protein